MSHPEHTANTASPPKTGFFALLCGLLRIKGSGAPSFISVAVAPVIEPDAMLPNGQLHAGWVSAEDECPRSVGESDKVHRETWKAECERRRGQGAHTRSFHRPVLATLLATLGALAFTAAPAFAASPEPPELQVEPVFATTATFHGVLNPKGSTGGGEYQFVYREGSTCKGAGEKKNPVALTVYPGAEREELPALEIKGLTPGKEYAACLVAKNKEGEASSTPVVFTTTAAGAPEAPEVAVEDSTAVVPAPSVEARLHGVLNPKAGEGEESEVGVYRFVYRKQLVALENKCEGSGQVTTASDIALGAPHEEVSEPVTSLTAGTEYAVCLLAERVDGKKESSVSVSFTTPIPPQTPRTEAAVVESASSATLQGELNPSGKATTGYHFLYNAAGTCAGGTPTEEVAPAELEKAKVEAKKVEGLEPNTKYAVCLIATNSAGETAQGTEVSFETPPVSASVRSESVSAVKSKSATLEAVLNPNNETTSYTFEYATNEALTENSGTVKGTVSGGEQAVVAPTGEALTPGTTYYYRVTAENAQSKGVPSLGKVESFTTVPVPSTDPVSEVSASTAVFNGHFVRDAVDTKYSFDYKANPANPVVPGECEGESSTNPVEAGAGSETVSEPTQVTGLTPGTPYAVCLVTSNAFGSEVGSPVTFATPVVGPPAVIVGSYFETELTADSVELHAEINPNGAVTTYSFQYGTSTTYGHSTPAAALGASDDSAHPATALVQGLTPGVEYHYRVVASNEVNGKTETVTGPDHTFTTQDSTSTTTAGLIDDRQWEQVSPIDKHGARIESISKEGGLIQAAQDGTAMTYTANGPTEANPEGNPSLADVQVMSVRGSAGGWSSRDIATPHEHQPEGLEVGQLEEYYAFNQDLTKGLVEPKGLAPKLTSNSPETGIYIREKLSEPIGVTYTALINNENTAPSTHYGNNSVENIHPTAYVAASSNLKHVVLASVTPLTAAYPTGGYYEWTNGVLTPITILNGELLHGSVSIGDGNFNVRNAVSEDGNHVFFTFELNAAERHLYVRDVALGRTVQIDLPQGTPLPLAPGAKERDNAIFSYATPNGERVYFSDEQRLTSDATAEYQHPELYEYNTKSGVLTDLAPGKGAGGEVIGASETGEYVYFGGEGGALYVEHVTPSGDVISLITILSGADSHDIGSSQLTKTTARVSPDGRFLAFMSSRNLTGYDNTNAGSTAACGQGGICDQEVFEYDAVNGRLSCASCDPTGARPHGVLDIFESGEGLGLLVDRPQVWVGSWLAGSVPGWTAASPPLQQSDYQSKYLGDSGRLFFTSPDALVPQDTNGKEDVYEYEPEGPQTPGCSPTTQSSSEVFEPAHGFAVEGRTGESGPGCVGLISSGKSSTESAFLDASENGDDVFFLTAGKLSPQDVDDAADVYDAHVCSSESPCPSTAAASPPPCTTADSCRAAPTQQPEVFGAGPTETFNGAGNASPTAAVPAKKKSVPRCKQGFITKKNRCVRSKKAKKKARAKKAINDRRASR